MTNAELNRDIKRLYKSIEKSKELNNDDYYSFIEKEAKPEFLRLYGADREGTALNLLSFKIMHRLNQTHKFVAFHMFYINLEVKL